MVKKKEVKVVVVLLIFMILFAVQRGQEPAAVLRGQGSICPPRLLRLGGLLCPCDESSFADRN